jgi:sugar phosphate permease
MGIVFVPLTLAATEDAATTDQGLASGIWNTSQQIGSALGLASLAAVASAVTGATRTPQAQVDGFDTAFGVAVGFAVVAFLVVAASLRRTDGAARADEAKAGNVADTLAS